VRVRLESETDDRVTLRLEVLDTGIGLSDEGRSRLFQPFQQADSSTTRKYGGTGLGLAISRQLVQLMGGEMAVDSVLGRGSVFWFTIDVAKASRSPASRLALRALGGARVRALIVEPSQINRVILRRYFALWQVDSAFARSFDEAQQRLRAMAARGERAELVLFDADGLQMDPLYAVRFLRQEFSATIGRVVLIANTRRRPDADAARAAGIDATVGKPLREAKLFNLLTSVLRPEGVTEPRKRRSAKRAQSVAKSRARILLAEDNPVNQKVAVHMLDKLGYRCDIASNGLEAVTMLQQMPYDLVLMDCQMPEMDGFQATAAIRAKEGALAKHGTPAARLPIVALTANALKGDRERCLDAGMDDYIAKPFRKDDLERMLKCWLDRPAERPVTPGTPQ